MESGKGRYLVNPCPAEIAIPIVVAGQGSDKSESGTNSSNFSSTISNSQSEKANTNGTSVEYSQTQSLRRRASSRVTAFDSTENELQIQRPSMGRTKYAQPKSRVMELEPPSPASSSSSSFSKTSLSRRIDSLRAGSLPPAREHDEDDDDRSEDEADEDDDDDKNKKNENPSPEKSKKRGKITLKAINGILEWTVFVAIMVLLVASLFVHKLNTHVIWGLEIWRWCVLAAVFLCGRLVTRWAKHLIVFLIESKFLFNERVVYFVHGVKQSVRVVIWLAIVLLAWFLLVDRGVQRSRKTTRILKYITKALGATLIAAVMWMIKTLLVKLIAASFHVKTFFSKIREAISNEYVLWTLSLPQSIDSAENGGSGGLTISWCFKIPKWKKGSKDTKEKAEEITIKKLGKMKSGKMPVSTMGHLMDRIRSSKLSIISSALDDGHAISGEQKEITSRPEVEEAASQIFHNVKGPDHSYIEEADLLPLVNKENVDCLMEWFQKVAEDGKISEEALKNWAVNIYKEREFLSYSLKDAKTAIEELNRILSAIVLVLIVIVWLLLMGLATTKVLVVLSSQLIAAVFIFGNACKTLFEAMIFVFVMHPFDVGDRCVIDGVMMVVEEMDILKTTFLRYDNEMIYYPNAVLATKAISNFYRSPERMGDSVNFDIDVSTSVENIQALKADIKEYIGENSHYWHPDHSVQIKEIENMNKMKMVLFVNHKMNFQNFLEKMNRRTELMLGLKEIFEKLEIKYHLLPQEVHISYVGSAVPATTPPVMPSRSVL